MIEYIIKRDGREEPFDANKLNGWGEWGTKSLDKKLVDWSSIILKVVSSLPVKVPAQDLQDALIKTCLDMDTYEYNRMAGRLYAAQLSKSLYSERKHPHILELHKMLAEKGLTVFPNYTEEEYEAINKIINHKRDITYTYYSSYHIVSKYSLQDRVTRQKYETPQFVYMRVAMQTFNNYYESDRLEKLERLYTLFSQRKINVPTPYMTNSLTKNPNVSSCCILSSKDTAESIGVMNALAYMMTTAGAGLGVHFKTRSLNDPVRGGLIAHQGKIPYIRGLAHTVKSSKQGCYDKDTEVLTENGWKYFKDLTKEDLIIQVLDDLSVEAVEPTRIISYKHTGSMYNFRMNKSSGSLDIFVTPDHRMVYKEVRNLWSQKAVEKHVENGWSLLTQTQWASPVFSEITADKANLSRKTCIYNSAKTLKTSEEFSSLDALKVAYQADGLTKQFNNKISFHLAKTRKQKRLEGLLEDLKLSYEKVTHNCGKSYVYRVDKKDHIFCKNFNWVAPFNRSSQWLKSFLEELEHWGGTHLDTDQNSFAYYSTQEDCIDVAQMAASLCGAYSRKECIGKKKKHHKDRFKLNISFFKNYICSSNIIKEEVEYDDYVYCVEVPSNKIIVRRNGLTLVCGNSRGGMGTVYYPFFDPEIVSLLSLKNPLTTTVNRVRDADYALSINKWFVKRAIKKEPVWLFSYLDAPELYEAFYDKDEDKFPRMMEEFVKSHPNKVTEIRADEILSHALTESLETGRVYLFFADSANKKSPYTDKIYSSNLCIAGDQLVPSNFGLLTAEELYKLNEEESGALVLVGSGGLVKSSPMRLREKNVDVYEIRLENGMTHVVTDYHKVQTTRGSVECKNLVPDQDCVVFNISSSIHGTLHGPDDAYNLGMYHRDGTVSDSTPYDMLTEPDYIPEWVRAGNYETKVSYLQGLSGDLNVPEKATALFEGYSYNFLQELQVFLGTLGFYYKLLEGDDGYPALYPVLAIDELCNHTSKVVSVTYAGKEDVYCPTVDSEDHLFVSNCFLTRNCSEILLPTNGFNTYEELYQDDPEGIVAFCNLAGIVVSNIENDEEYEEACYYALLMIDEGINNANLPFPALNKSIRDWRSAGVGVLGLAHLMAKKRLSYTTQEGRNFMFSLGERHAYHLYKAALRLGKERGNAPNMDKTLFPEGWLPMDTANKNVLELVSVDLQYDWESLRKEIVANKGIRFTTVSTIPPSETSSISCSTTNGPYMIRELSLVKTSGSESNRWVAPEATKLAKYYERAWDVSNEHHINMYAIFNYWLDQTISADLYYDRSKDKNVSMAQLFKEVVQMAKYGVPTRYYCNSKIENEAAVSFLGHSVEEEVLDTSDDDSGCGSGGCTL